MILAKEIILVIRPHEPNFDIACLNAYHMAVQMFGGDDFGYMRNVPNWNRFCSSIVVDFVSYQHIRGMGREEFHYTFEARAEKQEE
jgi:hypothetical protein